MDIPSAALLSDWSRPFICNLIFSEIAQPAGSSAELFNLYPDDNLLIDSESLFSDLCSALFDTIADIFTFILIEIKLPSFKQYLKFCKNLNHTQTHYHKLYRIKS